jgi:hypothetical protein
MPGPFDVLGVGLRFSVAPCLRGGCLVLRSDPGDASRWLRLSINRQVLGFSSSNRLKVFYYEWFKSAVNGRSARTAVHRSQLKETCFAFYSLAMLELFLKR